MNESSKNFDQTQSSHRVTKFLVAIAEESEHACVILGASLLDEYLEKAIKGRLFPSENHSSDDELFGKDKPLGTFSAKIRLAYRLGVIDKNFRRCLNYVRKIRNNFAHISDPQVLSKSPHKEHLLEMYALTKEQGTYEECVGVVRELYDPKKMSQELERFIAIVVIMTTILGCVVQSNTPLELIFFAHLEKLESP